MIASTDDAYYLTYEPFRFVKLGIFGDFPWTGLEDLYAHPNGVNQLFCDGHFEFVKKKQIATQSDQNSPPVVLGQPPASRTHRGVTVSVLGLVLRNSGTISLNG